MRISLGIKELFCCCSVCRSPKARGPFPTKSKLICGRTATIGNLLLLHFLVAYSVAAHPVSMTQKLILATHNRGAGVLRI